MWSLASLALLNTAVGATSTHSASYGAGHATIHIADTFIDSHSDAADGAAVYLNLACLPGAGGFNDRILVRFDELVGAGPDQIHAGSLVLSATLTLTPAAGALGFDGAVEAALVSEAWDAPDATWALRRPATAWAEAGCGAPSQWASLAPSAAVATDPTLSIDVRDGVTAWVEGAVDNHGVVLWCESDTTAMVAPTSFVADEGDSSGTPGPVLVVEWVGPDRDGDGADSYSDCQDDDASIGPLSVEVPYDTIDQDCDGVDLDDVDGDGHPGGEGGDDCDDADPATHPGATEVPGDGVDQDCDGTDEEPSDTGSSSDTGGDTGGTTDDSGQGGSPDVDGDRWEVDEGDCDDTDAAVHPGATEACNGSDDVCDGLIDEDCPADAAVGCACSAAQGPRGAPLLLLLLAGPVGWARRRRADIATRTSPPPAQVRR